MCGILLLTSCTPKNTEPAETPEPEPISTEMPAEHNDFDSLPIDIEYVSCSDVIEWQDAEVELGGYTISIPDGWTMIDGTDYGLVNGTFFVPPETNLENFRFGSHIAIEILEEPYDSGEHVHDYSLQSTQKDFFATMTVTTFSKMGGLSDLEYSVWN